ncbi:hypothetical protein JCM5353_007147 [Sporobolomyces roseus]
MADVLSCPPIQHQRANGPSTSSAPYSLGPRRLPSEDILTETLAYPDADRDYTDDLEDLVSMQVTQQLHSRRSQQTINTMSYLPTRESTNSFQNLPLSSSDYPPTSPTSPTQRSLIPVRQGNPSSRSPSPEVPRENSSNLRSGSISSSHSLSRIPSPINPVAMSRGNSNQSNTSSIGVGGENAEDKWETLQVGNKQLSTRTPTPRSQATTSKPFPSTSTSTSTSSRQPSSKPALNASNPRKRAQTNLSTSPSSSSTSTPRKPNQTRTALTPSPSTSTSTSIRKKSTHTPPVRRKSLSYSTYPTYSDSDAFPLPSALENKAPQVFMNDQGEFVQEGRADQLVIPTVARRIEAERLKRLMDEGQGGVLVSEWGVDGLPRMEGKWKERPMRREDGAEGERIGDQQEGAGDRANLEEMNGVEKGSYSDHPYASNEPADPQPSQLRSQTRTTSIPPHPTLPTTVSSKEKETTLGKKAEPNPAERDKDVEKAGCCSCVIC